MAFIVPYSDPKLKKPNLLKDYLLDDLSSCSSNGFRSFPRRQCCTSTLRFLEKKTQIFPLNHNRSTLSSPAKSLLRRASMAVINAVKRLPFASTAVNSRRAVLPRSVSRKFFKRSFWKKSEIEHWKSFHTVVDDKSPSVKIVTVNIAGDLSSCSKNKSYSSSISWADSEFTSNSSCSSGNSGTVNSNDEQVVLVGKRVSVIVGEAIRSPTNNCDVDSAKDQWPNEEDKKQFSPVSVLDCPFDNDDGVEEEDDEVSSAFKHKSDPVEAGTKHKVKKNFRRPESLSKLEPVALEKRIALAECDNVSVGSHLSSIQENNILESEEEDKKTAKKAEELLEKMKAKTPAMSFQGYSDNLFLDFFIEATIEDNNVSDCELLDVAKDWMDGKQRELLMGWEVQKNREAYIREMEKGGMWSKSDKDRQEVAFELEAEIFTSLVNDLFVSS